MDDSTQSSGCANSTATAGTTSRRFQLSLTRRDRRSLLGMYGFIVLLHVIGFGVLLTLVVPKAYDLGGSTGVYGVGVGVLAYTLGLRHAFDADHIATVDNTTRKLLADNPGRKPLSVGFWFSLGHSTIVFALTLLLSSACAPWRARCRTTVPSCTGFTGASERPCPGPFCGSWAS